MRHDDSADIEIVGFISLNWLRLHEIAGLDMVSGEHKPQRVRVLLIEDDEDDYVLIRRQLTEVSPEKWEIKWVQTCDEGLKELRDGAHDVCLLDYRLGSSSGLEVLAKVEESAQTPPIIILTGQGDYFVDVRAMECGAADYLVKDGISGLLLERSIRYSMERKKAKDALRESEKQLKNLASALLKVQENERRALASELHDDLGQLLMAVKFHIESALVRMPSDVGWASDLESLIPSIQEAVERVRNMYTQLMPTVLDDLGILPTLRWFCREFKKDHSDIEVESELEIEEQELPDDLKLVIFRIVQDAFKNVADHSRALHAKISLVKENEHLRLSIRDDGIGFDTSRASSRSEDFLLGLMTMERRAELSGGSIKIESDEGMGNLVSVEWPL